EVGAPQHVPAVAQVFDGDARTLLVDIAEVLAVVEVLDEAALALAHHRDLAGQAVAEGLVDQQVGVRQAVAADGALDHDAVVQLGLAGGDADRAAVGVTAVQGALRAAQYFDL